MNQILFWVSALALGSLLFFAFALGNRYDQLSSAILAFYWMVKVIIHPALRTK